MKLVTVVLLATCCAAQNVSIQTAELTAEASNAGTQPRIIGGTNTTIEKYPYIVQVLYFRSAICGGSLVTVRHVLSAAHCFIDDHGVQSDPRSFTIRAGSTTLGAGGQIHTVSLIITHERYNRPVANDNDIAILLLATAVTVGPRVGIAKIPIQGNELEPNSVVIHLGWGTTNAQVHMPSVILQEVEIRTINEQECFAQYQLYGELVGYPGGFPVTSNMICSGLLGIGGKDACQGDSGGPLQYGADIVVGVTSWGAGCGEPLFPGVNVKVSAYTNWINDMVTIYNASPPVGKISGILMLVSLVASVILSSK